MLGVACVAEPGARVVYAQTRNAARYRGSVAVALRLGARVLVAVALLAAGPMQVSAAGAHSKQELKCAQDLSKGAQRLAAMVAREYGRCRIARVKGDLSATCPTAKGQSKIAKAVEKLDSSAVANCVSTCSVSNSLACIGDDHCPPVGDDAETCSAGAADRPFDMGTLGFPGP